MLDFDQSFGCVMLRLFGGSYRLLMHLVYSLTLVI
jgi:hypothetical protein